MRASRRRGRLVGVAGVVAALGACSIAPPALGEDWQAGYVGQCCYSTLESGETATSWFDEKNLGTKTWYQAFVNLGTDGPQDRQSTFFTPGDWLSAERPTALDQQTVAPGQVGRFTFVVTAPQVQQPTRFQEKFQPVADGFTWMGGGVWLDYTVLPSQPPAVQITSAPASAQMGDPISVAASATDNRVVDHVDFTLGDHTETLTAANGGANTYAANLPTAGLAPGTHTVVVRAHDRAGNSSFSSATFYLREPAPAPQPEPAPVPEQPTKSIRADVTLQGRPTRAGKPLNGLDVTLLKVAAPRGSRIDLTCTKGACKGYSLKRTTQRTTALTRRLRKFVKAGARIEVRVTHAEFVGLAVTYKIASGDYKRTQRELK